MKHAYLLSALLFTTPAFAFEESDCQIYSELVYHVAEARDIGISRDDALSVIIEAQLSLDKNVSLKALEGSANLVDYVYRFPRSTPKAEANEFYAGCAE